MKVALFLAIFQLSFFANASGFQCADLFSTTAYINLGMRPNVLLDKKSKKVFKILEDMEEVDSLYFADWLFKKFGTQMYIANKPLQVFEGAEFLADQKSAGMPREFLDLIEDESVVVSYDYINGKTYPFSDIDKYPQQQRRAVQERARLNWQEMQRMMNWVNAEKLQYKGRTIKASLDLDEFYFWSEDSRSQRMKSLNGPLKMVSFDAGYVHFTLAFGGGNEIHSGGSIYLIDPY